MNTIPDNQSKKHIISFKAGFQRVGIPFLVFSQGGKLFNFLLDTGSNECVIDKRALKELGHTHCWNQLRSITGLDGIEHTVSMVNITLNLAGEDYAFEYQVVDMKKAAKIMKENTGVELHGLIGSSFLRAFNFVIDYGQCVAYQCADGALPHTAIEL